MVAIFVCGFLVGKLQKEPPAISTVTPEALSIDRNTGNYGLFINNGDNNYFSTHDANVRNIIEAYLANHEDRHPDGYPDPTAADIYGRSLVYYFTDDVFIEAWKNTWDGAVVAYELRDIQSGQIVSDCVIYAESGLYKDEDVLLSVSYTGSFLNYPPDAKPGVCLYERGAPNFTFIDLSSKLTSTETLFNDVMGQILTASIKDVDTQKRTFAVDVYDTTKTDVDGNYAYKRSIEVSY